MSSWYKEISVRNKVGAYYRTVSSLYVFRLGSIYRGPRTTSITSTLDEVVLYTLHAWKRLGVGLLKCTCESPDVHYSVNIYHLCVDLNALTWGNRNIYSLLSFKGQFQEYDIWALYSHLNISFVMNCVLRMHLIFFYKIVSYIFLCKYHRKSLGGEIQKTHHAPKSWNSNQQISWYLLTVRLFERHNSVLFFYCYKWQCV